MTYQIKWRGIEGWSEFDSRDDYVFETVEEAREAAARLKIPQAIGILMGDPDGAQVVVEIRDNGERFVKDGDA